jgi:hypothetical protein
MKYQARCVSSSGLVTQQTFNSITRAKRYATTMCRKSRTGTLAMIRSQATGRIYRITPSGSIMA